MDEFPSASCPAPPTRAARPWGVGGTLLPGGCASAVSATRAPPLRLLFLCSRGMICVHPVGIEYILGSPCPLQRATASEDPRPESQQVPHLLIACKRRARSIPAGQNGRQVGFASILASVPLLWHLPKHGFGTNYRWFSCFLAFKFHSAPNHAFF